jgi:hypothetical protein
MEFCGAYHFGQWAYTFAEQPHYASTESDLQQTASQDEFGHPYAFVGIPGIGTGLGWESIMHNTGHYLTSTTLRTPKAVIRGIAYYDYVARLFRLQDMVVSKVAFYHKSTPPDWETLHNPVPYRKQSSSQHLISAMRPAYTPYIGTLANHIEKLIEANSTVPPYNFAFLLITSANIFKVDPRPRDRWQTELERVWGGKSARFYPYNDSIMEPGLLDDQRKCKEFIYYEYNHASPEPEVCGENFTECCTHIDAPGLNATACNIGVAPTLCQNATVIQLTNITEMYNGSLRPYPFWVVNWTS